MTWLFKIPYFRKAAIDYAFKVRNKPPGFESLSMVFRDKNGHGWFTFNKDFDLYMSRKADIDTKLIELSSQLSRTELDQIIQALKEAINKPKPDLQTIGFLVGEMEKRQEMLVHKEIILDLLCLHYVREDENPAIVDPEIHAEKVQYIKDNLELRFFFDNQRFTELLPWLEGLDKNLKELLNDTEVEILALRKWTDQYITQQEPTSSKKT